MSILPTLTMIMKYTSNEISTILYKKQIALYTKIDNLITQKFNELDPDMLSVLTRTLMDLDDKLQTYKKELKTKEMYENKYDNHNLSLTEILKSTFNK